MNEAGIVAILALVVLALRALAAHVVILPGVIIPVAGLVFMILLALLTLAVWLMLRHARRNGGLFCACWVATLQ